MRLLRQLKYLLQETIVQFLAHKAPQLAAALAFYTLFSMAPMIIIAVNVAGVIFGRDAAQGELVAELTDVVGEEGAVVLQNAIQNATQTDAGMLPTLIGIVTFLFGATIVFVQLQDSLNTIWDIRPKVKGLGIRRAIRERFQSFVMVLGVGVLLAVFMVASTVLSAVREFAGDFGPAYMWTVAGIGLNFAIVTLLFGTIYRVLPDVRIEWSDVGVGAVVTAALFTLGTHLIGLYLGQSTVASTYGAAGSLVAMLLWIYYSSIVVFFGAQLTKVYAECFGSRIRPTRRAISLSGGSDEQSELCATRERQERDERDKRDRREREEQERKEREAPTHPEP
jgi:membrane protein